jgi:hypothetical protein
MATTPPQIEREDEQQETEILAPAQVFDSQTLAVLQKSEIDQQIATAKKYPRQITKLLSSASALVTADAETADECIYALPRGGKVIEGPSIRFAEMMIYAWGNCRCGARVIGEDDEFVTALGSFFDLEANVAVAYEVKRRITDKKGNRYNSDMVGVTSNAACSIALRNAILRGIPKPIWRKVYTQARMAVAGDLKTLDTRRASMLKSFELMGAKRDAIFLKLGVQGIEDITLDHLVSLRGIFNAVREHEISVDKAFAPEPTEDTNLANKSKQNLEKIKEKYAQPAGEAAAPEPPADPERSEKLRKEATRQKQAVTEKYGAKQPGAARESTSTAAQPVPMEAPTVAPSELQAVNGNNSQTTPAQEGPGEAGADPGPAPEVDDNGQHGIPLAFGEPEPEKGR